MSKGCSPSNCWTPFLFIFLLSTAIAWPLFGGKIIWLADGPYAFIKTVAMDEAWRNGDFVARWVPDLIHGNGYPMFNFYAPLFSYFSAFLMLLSLPAFWAFNLCIYLGLLGSGITMYLFAREIWGKQGGLLAAVAYLVAPYHILDLYARGALAEFTAFVFFPLVMRAIYRVMNEIRLSDILIGVMSTAALILSHNIAALFFCSFSFIYLIYLFLTDPKRPILKLMASLSIFAGGALLTTYFWLPALMEKKYVQIERLLIGIYDYHRNFISLSQLILPSWPQKGDELSFMVGPVHLVLALAVVLLCFKVKHAIKGSGRQVIFFVMAMIVSIILTLPFSGPIWKHVPLLAFAEFPWRFLMCTTAAVSVLIGGFIFLFKEELRGKVMWAACAILISGSAFSWHAFGYQNIKYTSAKEYLRASYPMDDMEYLPEQVTRFISDPSLPKLEMISGPMNIIQAQEKYLDDRYQIHTENLGNLCYHTFNFPGWRVEVNKTIVPIIDNPWGLIIFEVPPGDSQVRIYFTKTPIQQAAENISRVAVLIFILCVLFFRPLDRFLFK
jgi:hypothetical protein